MLVKELYKNLETYINNGCGDYPLVITLREPSVGPRASIGIDSVFPGFDWESGQMRIEPSNDGCTSYKKDRDIPCGVSVKEYDLNGKKTIIRRCKFCGEKIRTTDIYCCKCGHKLKMERKEED